MAQEEPIRVDETWFRLREWTYQQAPSERLAAQILHAEGYRDIDPSHPLGGKDDGHDGQCTRDGDKWTWAVYFPRGEHDFSETRSKLKHDIEVARKHAPKGIAFVTNQEVRLAERSELRRLGGDEIEIDLFHLERIALILDRPSMAPVREQYLKIAASRPPMLIQAEIIGVARVFTGDEDILDLLVENFEKEIRETSDKAWATLKAEEAKNARAAEEAARRAAKEAQADNADRLSSFTGIHLPQLGYQNFISKFGFDGPDFDSPLAQFHAPGMERSKPPKPLTDPEIEQRVADYRTALEGRWGKCKAYTAGVSWPGLKFRISNEDKPFLTNLQVVLTFHGAQGTRYESIEDFQWEKLEDPSWTPKYDGGLMMSVTAPPLPSGTFGRSYPVTFGHNDGGDLEVKITLPELRPRETWTSDDDDVVLMLHSYSGRDEITVTYTATAYEYNEIFEAAPISVRVEKVSMHDAVIEAIEAVE